MQLRLLGEQSDILCETRSLFPATCSREYYFPPSEMSLQQTLPIATAINSAYLIPLQVMLASLCEHLNPAVRPVLYLINHDLTRSDIAKIGELVETHSVVPSQARIAGLPHQRGYLTIAAFPLLIAELLPTSIERILFLDPDLLVLDDLAKIWETDLRGRVVGAVTDQAIPRCSSPRGVKGCTELGIPDSGPYFNAGVMLIDLARWRSLDVSARACRYMDQHAGDLDFYHQEALNAVLWNDWMELDPHWNLIASLTGRRYAASELSERASKGIVHFAGKFKPWRVPVGGPFAAAYNDYLLRHSIAEQRSPTSLGEKLLGIYDRYLRDYTYGLERALWNHRLI